MTMLSSPGRQHTTVRCGEVRGGITAQRTGIHNLAARCAVIPRHRLRGSESIRQSCSGIRHHPLTNLENTTYTRALFARTYAPR
jgi:hypothetical protein